MASIVSCFTSTCYSTGLDDITSYKKEAEIEQISVAPYTTQEIIGKVANHLDEENVFQDEVYGKEIFFYQDPKTIAFNKAKFGNCEEFYVGQSSLGNTAFNSTVKFFFPKNEEYKENLGGAVKGALKHLEDPFLGRSQPENCKNHLAYATQLKDFLNSIAQAAPSILEKNQNKIAAAKIKEEKRLAVEKSMAKENASKEAKKQADIQAKEKAEKMGKEANAKKLATCQQKVEYQLYEVSLLIQLNNNIAKNSQKEIDSQNESAKISGVVDKRVKYVAGNRIVGARESNKELFVAYKKMSGTAKTPETVVVPNNPCSSLEGLNSL
jgi:hypothetical protein